MYTRIFQFAILSPCLWYAFPVLCYVFSNRTQYIFTLSKDLELRGCKVLKHCRPCALKCPSSTTPILPLAYNNESLYRPHTQRPDRTSLLSLQAWKKYLETEALQFQTIIVTQWSCELFPPAVELTSLSICYVWVALIEWRWRASDFSQLLKGLWCVLGE